jgi:hypothetical protein
MLSALPTATVLRDGKPLHPLAGVNVQADQDFTMALLDSWAVVADIISFYGARIADEGFVGTAIEPSSIFYMAEALGYKSWNGASSRTWLQLTVSSTSIPQDKRSTNAVLISPQNNVVVQSIPNQGDLPIIFETSEEAELRLDWNQFQPYQATRTDIPVLTPGMTGIRLQGAISSLQAGDPVLITTAASRHIRFLDAVNVQRTQNYTAVTWQDGLKTVPNSVPGEAITGVFAFRQQAGLFARRSLAWDSASDAIRGRVGTRSGGILTLTPPMASVTPTPWLSIDSDVPAEPVRVLLSGPGDTLFAATAGGVFLTSGPNWKAAWTVLPLTPARQDLHSLVMDDRGYLYAGGTRGAISFSTDDGQSWQSLAATVAAAVASAGTPNISFLSWVLSYFKNLFNRQKPTEPDVAQSAAPKPSFDGVIRAIASGMYGKNRYIFVGTDLGVFFMQDGGSEWTPFNQGLPNYNSATGLAGTVVYALILDGGKLYAGTGTGLYLRNTSTWTLVLLPFSPQPAVYSLLLQSGILVAGTSEGVFLYAPSLMRVGGGDKGNWIAENNNLPSHCAVKSLAGGTNGKYQFLLAGTDTGVYRASNISVVGFQWVPLNRQELALFTADASSDFLQDLKKNVIPPLLSHLFIANGDPLPEAAMITSSGPGCWVINSPAITAIAGADPANFAIIRQDESTLHISRVVPISSEDIQTVAATSTGQCFAAAPTGPFLEQQWPGFQLDGTTIPLDRIVSTLRPGDPIGLIDSTPDSLPLTATIVSAGQMPYQSFGRQATVTVLTVEPNNRLGLLSPRNTTVLLNPSSLPLYTPDVPVFSMISGNTLDLVGTIDNLRDQQALAISGLSPAAIIPSAGGVIPVIQTTGLPSAGAGLLSEDIQALVSDGKNLWAAAVGVGVYTRPVHSPDPWLLFANGLTNLDIRCLALTSIGLWAGTSGGVFLLESSTPPKKPVWIRNDSASAPQDVVTFTVDKMGNLFAGTETEGVFRRSGFNPNWSLVASGTEVPDVRALTTDDNGSLYIGTRNGIYQVDSSTGQGLKPFGQSHPTFRSPREPLLGQAQPNDLDVTALACRDQKLFAGTSAGSVLCLPITTHQPPPYWTLMEPDTIQAQVRCFSFADNTILAGTGGDGIFRWSPRQGWIRVFTSASNDVSAMVYDPSGALFAGCSNSTVLQSAVGAPIRTSPIQLFKAPADCASQLDLETVPPSLATLFQQHAVTLQNPFVTIIEPGALWTIQNGSSKFVVRHRDLTPPTEELVVALIPNLAILTKIPAPSLPSELFLWTFNDGTDTGSLLAPLDQVLITPSMPGSPTRAEIVTLVDAIASPTGESTRCTLASPLQYLYDPAATTLSANLVYATQGVTIGTEVLGSGNATIPNQSFTLKRPPLTYAYGAPPDSQLESSLNVIVGASNSVPQPTPSVLTPPTLAPSKPSGELWTELPTLYGAPSSARAYSLSTDYQGNTYVNFGDGSNGSRLPTGVDNIRASYRTGIGPGGNVPASSLIVFRKRPLGVTTVSNPVAASDGSNPEDVSSIRSRLGLATRAIDRIVALSDYPNFCLAQTNITKARVDKVPPNAPQVIVLTLGAREALPVDEATIKSLTKAIASKRASQEPFVVLGFTPVLFRIKATIKFDDDAEDNILIRVTDALSSAFSFAQRQFAQGVTASEITAVIQLVSGVNWVEISSLYYTGSPATLSPSLSASAARWDQAQGVPLPAELLLLDLTDLYDSLYPPDRAGAQQ